MGRGLRSHMFAHNLVSLTTKNHDESGRKWDGLRFEQTI